MSEERHYSEGIEHDPNRNHPAPSVSEKRTDEGELLREGYQREAQLQCRIDSLERGLEAAESELRELTAHSNRVVAERTELESALTEALDAIKRHEEADIYTTREMIENDDHLYAAAQRIRSQIEGRDVLRKDKWLPEDAEQIEGSKP